MINEDAIHRKRATMKNHKRNHRGGYTLLEMAIVLFVVGLFMASGASAYNIYAKNKAVMDTANNINIAMNAISNYFIQNGRYPCPARLNAQRTDADYGMPTNCTTDPAILAMNPGDYLNGLYMEERDSTIATLVPPKPIVLRGAIPFRILNKPESVAEDGYHTRLEYAVTQLLTDTMTYNKDHGGISVVDAQTPPRSVVKTPDSIHFIVLTHGQDRAGAWSSNGGQVFPCGTGKDEENCNTSMPNKRAVYRMAQMSMGDGADHFDDTVKFFSMIETPLWTVADAAGTNIRDAGLALQAAIGNTTSAFPLTDPLSLDAQDYVRADGNVDTPQWCDSANPADCFSPSLIGGDDPNMDCQDPANPAYDATKPYVTGVGSKKVACGATVDIKCTPPQVMTGVLLGGSIKCSASPVSCSATPVTICTLNDYTLPAAAVGVNHTNPIPFGDSKYKTYTCTAAGTWSYVSESGTCSCTPSGPSLVIQTCQSYKGSGCWSGDVTYTSTTTCSPYSVTTTAPDTSACVCNDCAVPTTTACNAALPSPLTNPSAPSAASPPLPTVANWIGNPVYNRNWVCSSATAGSFVDYTYVNQSPVCTCNASISDLVETNVACTITGCDATGAAAFNGQFACSAGFAGGGKYVNRKKSHNCATGAYDTTWTNTANTCSCAAITAPDPIPCPTGYSGTIARTKTFDCALNAWGTPVQDLPGSPPSTCNPIRWVPQGSITGSGASKIGVEAYDSCGPVNATSACSKPASSGSGWDYYAYCTCL